MTRSGDFDFHANINYPPGIVYVRAPIAWSVVEADGGTVSPGGRYTAPGTPGTFHVRAQREDYPSVTVTATVTVRP